MAGGEVSLGDALEVLRRRWWIVLLVPLVAAGVVGWRLREQPYQTTVRATVLIPGDTEVPGSSERPELMVLDDLPALVASRAFAEGVFDAILVTELTADDVQASLAGARYSRILTVTVTRDNAEDATKIGEAVAAALPELVNRYLVADGAAPATVRIIDPPGEPTRARPDQWPRAALQLVVALAAGIGLAFVVDALDPRLRSAAQIERAFGAPVLADLRAAPRPTRARSRS